MKTTTTLTFILIIVCGLVQQSCAQTSPCPPNNEQAEKVLKEYLAKERNIKSLRSQYDMAVSDSPKENIKSLSGKEDKEECRQLRSNLEWLDDQKHYSIYKVADHYFIVLYSFTEEDNFQMDEIPIINSEFEFLGSIINFDASK